MFQAFSSPGNIGSQRFPGKSVLIAEDNLTFQTLLKQFLADLGMRSLIVGNGELLLNALNARPCDLLVIDLQMPVLNGEQAIAQLRAAEQARALPRVPIIVISIEPYEQLSEALKPLIDGYLQKPISRGLLAAEIARLLS